MQNLQIYKLKFQSGFHVDDLGNESYSQSADFIHSDTLSSAVLSVWALRQPEKIEGIAKAPPYLLSSAFPFYDEIFFLPLPQRQSLIRCRDFRCKTEKTSSQKNLSDKSSENKRENNSSSEKMNFEENEFAVRKKLKRIQFLPAGLWGALLSDPACRLVPIFLPRRKLSSLKTHKKNSNKQQSEQTPSEGSGEIIFKLSKNLNFDENEMYRISSPFLIPFQLDSAKTENQPFGKEEQQPIQREENQRVAVSRLSNQAEDGKLFSFSRVQYGFEECKNDKPLTGCKTKRTAGLWFFARFPDKESRAEFEENLALLGDTGIGSDKSSGNGQFEFDSISSEEIMKDKSSGNRLVQFPGKNTASSFPKIFCNGSSDLLVVGNSQKQKLSSPSRICNLSLFCPGAKDLKSKDWLADEGAQYELKRRGGWIHGKALRRKTLFMFAEGGCFKNPKTHNLTGDVKNVTPDNSNLGHKVFRDGRGFFIGFD